MQEYADYRKRLDPIYEVVKPYEQHCQDGFGSAFAAYKKFGDNATYIPTSDRLVPPAGLINKEVYVVDLSYPKEVLLELEKNNKRFVIIDHHFSAEEAVRSVKEHIFALDHAASYLCWQYFVGTEVPELINILEIIDIAKDKEGNKVDAITYILSKPYEFSVYEQLLEDFSTEDGIKKLSVIGKAQHDYLMLLVDAIIDDPDFVEFEGYIVPCVNLNLPINEKSILLARLYAKYPPFAMSYRFDNGQVKVSLRGNGEVDLTKLAGKYGGGGHKSSSGFVLPIDYPLPFAKAVKKEDKE